MFRAPLIPLGGFGPGQPEVISIPSLAFSVSASQIGVCILVSDPIIKTYRREYIQTITGLESYSHKTRAIGGYSSADISFRVQGLDVSDWILNGLGRHIETYNQAQQKVWEGFVNQITATIGGIEYTVGPLIGGGGVGNKVRVSYSAVDYSISPPATGVTLKTAYATNSESQNRWGILEKTLSVNEVTETIAKRIRDSWISVYGFPRPSNKISFSDISDIMITLTCQGYWTYLDSWVYSNSDVGGVSIRDKIIAVLESSPNVNLFSTNYGNIAENETEIKAGEDGNRTPSAILSEIASYGDSNNTRHNIGLYEDRTLYYQPAPSSVEYYKFMDRRVTKMTGSQLFPWDILPGNWILHSGIVPIEKIPESYAELANSSGIGYIEAVSFSTPLSVDIEIGLVSGIDGLTSRLGITGI